MSYEDGMAALRLEMPPRVPRTEYSAERHWKLIEAVTGISVDEENSPQQQQEASSAFVKAWNYDFIWMILIHNKPLDKKRTRMGHAEYAAGGTDYDNEVSCPFASPEEVLKFDPYETYGPVDVKKAAADFEAHYKSQCELYPDAVNMTGIYITCMSGLIEMFGWDMMLLAAGVDMEKFGEVTNRYAKWIQQYFDALAMADVPVVMVHDDIVWTSGAFLPPAWYRKYLFPNYKRYFAPLHEAGKILMYTSDGNYTEFIDDIAQAGVSGFVMEPTTDMKYIAEKYGKTHSFIGNADTRILLDGTKEQIRAEVERCMAIGKYCPGFFMAVGNHIPANTPVENAMYYNEVYEELSKR